MVVAARDGDAAVARGSDRTVAPVVRLSRDLLTVHVRSDADEGLLARLGGKAVRPSAGTVPGTDRHRRPRRGAAPGRAERHSRRPELHADLREWWHAATIELLDAGTVPAPTPTPPAETWWQPSRRRRPLARGRQHRRRSCSGASRSRARSPGPSATSGRRSVDSYAVVGERRAGPSLGIGRSSRGADVR